MSNKALHVAEQCKQRSGYCTISYYLDCHVLCSSCIEPRCADARPQALLVPCTVGAKACKSWIPFTKLGMSCCFSLPQHAVVPSRVNNLLQKKPAGRAI